jgi:hypothetical protein
VFDLKCLKSISFHPGPTNFRVRDEMVEDASGRVLVLYFGSAVSVVIGRSIEMISDGCYREHATLASVSFESNSALERIGEWAFWNGKLTGGIVVPRSVRVLAVFCFEGCTSLTSVTFESGSVLSEIGAFAFDRSGLRSIVIPASVQVIGNYAFADCRSLTSVTFEEKSNLRTIGCSAFQQCPCEGKVKIPLPQAEEATKTSK